MDIGVIISIAMLAAGAALYFFVIKKKSNMTSASGGNISYAPAPSPTGWMFFYSPGMTGDASDFNFPAVDGVHYVGKATGGPLKPGATITMNFTISGTGTFAAMDPGEGPPCHVDLYFQHVNDDLSGQGPAQFYRWFSKAQAKPLAPGSFSITTTLDVANFVPVGGNLSSGGITPDAGFADCLANAAFVGYTFGGQYFAGHGVAVTGGTMHFHLDNYTIV